MKIWSIFSVYSYPLATMINQLKVWSKSWSKSLFPASKSKLLGANCSVSKIEEINK